VKENDGVKLKEVIKLGEFMKLLLKEYGVGK
jgi:hypothetical protein